MAGRKNRRGWGWVRQSGRRPPKRWQASYVFECARHLAPHTFESKLEAEAWLAAERRLIDAETWTPPAARAAHRRAQAVTFKTYAATWLKQRRGRGGEPLRPATLSHYQTLVDGPLAPLAAIPMRSITPELVRHWHADACPDHPTMRAHAYGLAHAVMATAVRDGLLPSNPCQIERASKAARKRQPVILTPDELARLVSAMPADYRALVLISAWCGLRYGEVTELRRGDVSEDAEVITVARGVTHRDRACHISTPKSGVVRTVVVPPHVRPNILNHLKLFVAKGSDALLFAPARGGCHLNDKVFREHFTAAAKTVERPTITHHDLRHFCGTMTARVGNLRETMNRLGHATVGASLLYQQLVDGRDAEVAAALSELAGQRPMSVPGAQSAPQDA